MSDIYDDFDDCPEPWRSELNRCYDEIERLRRALGDLIDAIDASPRRLPHGPGPQEIGCQMRSMIYKVQGEAVEKAREATGVMVMRVPSEAT